MKMVSPSSPVNDPPLYHVGSSITYRLVQPLLIAALVTAFLTGITSIIRQGDPTGRWQPLGWFIFVVALQSTLTTLWLYHPDRRQVERVPYRVAEIIVLILAARLLTWFVVGSPPRLIEWRDYLLHPLILLDGVFVTYAALALLAWERSLSLSLIFSRLALGIDEATYYQQPAAVRSQDNYNPFKGDRQELVNQFLQSWVSMGVLLVICAAVTTFEVRQLARTFRNLTRLGLTPEILLALISYFLIGFWLLSQARLSAIYARWVAAGVTAQPAVWQRWNRTSLWLLLTIAGIAALLPIGSTIGLARILQAVGGVLFLVGGFLFTAVVSLISLLLSPLIGRHDSQTTAQPTPELLPTQPPPDFFGQTSLPPNDTAALLLGGLFWAVVIIVVAAALVFFLRERGYRFRLPAFSAFHLQLQNRWRTFWQRLRGQVVEIQHRLRPQPTHSETKASASPPPWRYMRLRGLPPREQIRFFYLAAVRRARERGVPREESETPLEFAQDLKANWPEAEGQVERLTHAFLAARYSRQEIGETDVAPVKRTWQQVRASLRQRRSTAAEDKDAGNPSNNT
ncbi:MAG: hypothetical protein Fur0021_19820 [Candidatus Promineifilaceae bacterium]